MNPLHINNKFSSLRNNMKNATRSPQGKEFFTFIIFLLLAAGVWCILAINENRERSIQIPLELENIPEQTILLQNMPSHIEARIRDKASVLLSYDIGDLEPIKINFEQHDNHKDAVIVSNNSLAEYAHRQLKATTSILSFIPDSIRIGYIQGEGKRVPIVASGNYTTSLHCVAIDSLYLLPDSATVYAKPQILKNIDCVYTEEFELHNLTDTAFHEVSIRTIPDTRIIPDRTQVVIPVEEFTTKSVTVPITVVNIPGGYSVMTFPANIQVSFLVPMSQYSSITSDNFLVGNDFKIFEQANGSYAPLRVNSSAKFIRNITLSQDSIEYIINVNNN